MKLFFLRRTGYIRVKWSVQLKTFLAWGSCERLIGNGPIEEPWSHDIVFQFHRQRTEAVADVARELSEHHRIKRWVIEAIDLHNLIETRAGATPQAPQSRPCSGARPFFMRSTTKGES